MHSSCVTDGGNGPQYGQQPMGTPGVSAMVDLSPDALEIAFKWTPVLLGKELKPEDYPITDLPPVIRKAVEEVQADVQAPITLVAACAFSVVSAAAQARWDVQRDAVVTSIGRSHHFKAIRERNLTARKSGRRPPILQSDLQKFLESLPVYEVAR